MSDRGRNAAGVSTGVSTGCSRAPVPATEGSSSEDPPPYSACVPHPPTVNSNYPDTRSSLLVNPSGLYPPNGISNHGMQTGNPYDTGSSAPFLDVTSMSENRPDVHDPRVTPYNAQPACNPSYMTTERDPPAYRHEPKTILLQRNTGNGGTSRRSIGPYTTIIVGIAISLITIAGITSRFTRPRKTNYHNYDSASYNPDINRETKINPVYTDPYVNTPDLFRTVDFGDGKKINVFNYEEIRRAMKERLNKILGGTRQEEKNETSRDVNINPTLDDGIKNILGKYGKKVDNDDFRETKFYPDIPGVLKINFDKFGEHENDDGSRDTDLNRIIDDRYKHIFGLSRNEEPNKNDVGKPVSDDDA